MDLRDCECGGRMNVTYSQNRIWGVYRIRTCTQCGKKIRTGETYKDEEMLLALNQKQAQRRCEHSKEYYWNHREQRLEYNHEYYKEHREYYLQKCRERYRRKCEERLKKERGADA